MRASISTADSTIASMTTRAVWFYPEDEFSRRFWTRQVQLRFPHLWTKWYSDMLDALAKSIQGNEYGQLFCNDKDWATIVPMCNKANSGYTFNQVV